MIHENKSIEKKKLYDNDSEGDFIVLNVSGSNITPTNLEN